MLPASISRNTNVQLKSRVRDVRAIWIVQGKQMLWCDRRDREARGPLWAIGHGISNLQVLALGQNVIRAGVVDAPEQLVEAGVGVPAAPVVAKLRHPWPDGGHRRVDRDRSRRLDLCDRARDHLPGARCAPRWWWRRSARQGGV